MIGIEPVTSRLTAVRSAGLANEADDRHRMRHRKFLRNSDICLISLPVQSIIPRYDTLVPNELNVINSSFKHKNALLLLRVEW